MSLINVRVARIADEAIGIRSFKLAKTGLFKLPRYTPGAHIDVHCGEGIIRQYSLCGDPDDRKHFMIAVRQVKPSRGGSDLMHLVVKEGDRLEIGSPRNNFPLDETISHAVLLAGGIGVTPIIAMADRLHALGRSLEMHYFSRSPKHAAFRARILNGAYANNVTLHEGTNIDETQEKLRGVLADPRLGGQIYMCGPCPFMDMAQAIALESWPADSVRLERFAANPALASAPTYPFTIKLARTGTTLEVGADETILDVLETNGINAAFSCEQGVCGTCVTKIMEGEPEHRDSFLSAKQKASNTRICLCVSRAKGRTLVLDI